MMDDDALDRLLFSLPLEEPPADLRGRILAATIYRPAPAIAPWEFWIIGVAVAVAAWLSIALFTWPEQTHAVAEGLIRAGAHSLLADPATYLWAAIGASAAFWLSSLTLPAPRRRFE